VNVLEKSFSEQNFSIDEQTRVRKEEKVDVIAEMACREPVRAMVRTTDI